MTAISLISNARARALSMTQKLDWLGPLVARITLGVLFVSTGWGKVHSLEKVTAYFSELGIPFPGIQAPMVSFIELIGGALLVIGLASRIAAVPLIGSMAVAILTAQRENVHGLPGLVRARRVDLPRAPALGCPRGPRQDLARPRVFPPQPSRQQALHDGRRAFGRLIYLTVQKQPRTQFNRP